MWELNHKQSWALKNGCFWTVVSGVDSWESLGLQRDQTSQSWRKSLLNIHWKDWCCSWSSDILATWCEELTHLERPRCWERLKLGGNGDNRGWDGWMVSLTQWTWVWASSRNWWWTGRPGVLQSMETQVSNCSELNSVVLATKIKGLPLCVGLQIAFKTGKSWKLGSSYFISHQNDTLTGDGIIIVLFTE